MERPIFFTEKSDKNEKWVGKLKQKWVECMKKQDLTVKEESDLGPFFVYTSNIDSHSLKAGLFNNNEVYEIHGSTEKWQCSDCCSLKTWNLPENYTFKVDPVTMRSNGDLLPPCPDCGKPSRPWVLMFSDMSWNGAADSRQRYSAWRESVRELLAEDPSLKLVIIEVGAGTNVPSVRAQSESFCRELIEEQANCTVVRINPDFPHTDDKKVGEHLISIMGRGLPTLSKIDELINTYKNK